LFAGTLGVGAIAYGLYKWFSRDKKEKSSNTSSNKKEAMSRWKK